MYLFRAPPGWSTNFPSPSTARDGKFGDQPGGTRDGWRGHATGDWSCPWASRAGRFMGDGIVVNDSQSCRLGFCLLHTTGEFVGKPGGARDGWRGHAPGDWRASRSSCFMSDSRVAKCPTLFEPPQEAESFGAHHIPISLELNDFEGIL
ncbi:hypothetical protein B0H13DRAFT_1856014 [Mycena leptocephala]|nr:hypothetical protein B0H13DRAFT_1856014 [Mycena leptocephala]